MCLYGAKFFEKEQNLFLQELFGLKNRVVIVTGGNGLLGTEFVDTIIRAGGRVVVFDKSPYPNEKLIKITQQSLCWYKNINIADELSVLGALESVSKYWGVPYALINNAGWAGLLTDNSGNPSEDFPTYSWQDILETNLTGAFICSKVVAKKMIENGKGGVIINISSTYGLVSPDQRVYQYKEKKTGTKFFKAAAYGASKAGLISLTKQNAAEWAQFGIRVNALCPGGVERLSDDPDFVKAYSERTPMGRMAHSDEFNGAILFLLSDSASYMTGATLVVDGGWTIW